MTSRHVLMIICLVEFANSGQSTTVEFGDVNRDPTSSLNIQGVVVTTGYDGEGLPSTVAGVGLGSATISPDGILDRIQTLTGYTRESLNLSVAAIAGGITSIVIAPFFSIVGSPDSIFIPFDISIFPNNYELYYHTLQNNSVVTLPIRVPPSDGNPSAIELGLVADFGNPAVVSYLQNHPGAVAQFGYSIQALTYTPSVPENGVETVAMLAIAFIAARTLRQRRTAKA